MVIFRASGGTGKHSADNIRILHCIAPQGRKFWFLGGFSTFLFIFAISHAYFLMFSYIILIYLCKLPYFTYHLGRGGPPRPKVQILDLFKTRYFSTIFFLYDLWLIRCVIVPLLNANVSLAPQAKKSVLVVIFCSPVL